MWLLAAGAVTAAWLPRPGADPARGERVFQRCFACHSVVAGEDGPGVVDGCGEFDLVYRQLQRRRIEIDGRAIDDRDRREVVGVHAGHARLVAGADHS